MKINLTKQEKRGAVKYFEEGKPFPEKYRFLLLENKREVELIWNGKTSEVTNIFLPFQTIGVMDESRAEKPDDTKSEDADLFSFDERGWRIAGWTNKLVWGDNKLILSSLKSGPIRKEIKKRRLST